MAQLLTKKYIPTSIESMYPTMDVQYFQNMIMSEEYPNIMLFHGPVGTGKTILARIVAANILQLDEEYTKELLLKGEAAGIQGYVEKDFTRDGRADQIREVVESMRNLADVQVINTKNVFVLDEFDHPAKDVQKMIVKPIDDIVSSNLFLILITNNPHKIEEAIRSRCIATEKEFKEVSEDIGTRILTDIAKRENKPLDKNTAIRLYQTARHKTPRSIILQLQSYFDSGTIEVSLDREVGMIRNYFVVINDIISHLTSSPVKSKEADSAVVLLYSTVAKLIYLKKSYSAVHLALCKYIESQMKSSIDITRLKKSSTIMNCLNEKSDLEYSYPVAELMRISSNIIEKLIQLQD